MMIRPFPRRAGSLSRCPSIFEWTPDDDVWELYDTSVDWSQANDLSKQMPEKLSELQQLFLLALDHLFAGFLEGTHGV